MPSPPQTPKPSKALVEKGEGRLPAIHGGHPDGRGFKRGGPERLAVTREILTAALDLDNAVERVALWLACEEWNRGDPLVAARDPWKPSQGWPPFVESAKDFFREKARAALAELGLLDPEEGGDGE